MLLVRNATVSEGERQCQSDILDKANVEELNYWLSLFVGEQEWQAVFAKIHPPTPLWSTALHARSQFYALVLWLRIHTLQYCVNSSLMLIAFLIHFPARGMGRVEEPSAIQMRASTNCIPYTLPSLLSVGSAGSALLMLGLAKIQTCISNVMVSWLHLNAHSMEM